MAPRKKSGGKSTGYGHPPEDTRFKPGQSGNPKGRPQGSPNKKTIVDKVLNEKITVLKDGKNRRVTKYEGVVRRMANDALNGRPHAQAQVFKFRGPAAESRALGPSSWTRSEEEYEELYQSLIARLRGDLVQDEQSCTNAESRDSDDQTNE